MTTSPTIDLNADLGEGFGTYTIGADQSLLPLVSSANIACGFHAGDPLVMQVTVEKAATLGIAIGAHPGYRDLVGFGRRPIDATPAEVYGDVLYQIGALAAFCTAAGVPLHHVKAHGALYNRAAVDPALADAIVRAVADFDPDLIIFAMPASALLDAARSAGMDVVAELFADRAINLDGTLVSRRLPGAMIEDPTEVAARAVRMVLEHQVTTIDGTTMTIEGQTICLHGDAPGAVTRARAVRDGLQAAGITVAPPAGTSHA